MSLKLEMVFRKNTIPKSPNLIKNSMTWNANFTKDKLQIKV